MSGTHFGLQVITIFIMAEYNDSVLNWVTVWAIKYAKKKNAHSSFQEFKVMSSHVFPQRAWMFQFIDDLSRYSRSRIVAE